MNSKLGLYIHIPFCVRKCAYCDFYSMPLDSTIAERYVNKILNELVRWGGILGCPPSDTLYFGGGTPSLLKTRQIEAIIDKSKQLLDPNYSFLLINAYTTGISPTSLKNILSLTFKDSEIETGEIGLPVTENNLLLPCGIYGKVSKH